MNIIKKIKITLMIILVITLISGIKVYAVTGKVNENVVYIRKSPTTDSNILTYATKEDKVDVIERDGDWYKVKYNGTTGYIYSKYVNVDEDKVEPAEVETTVVAETTTEDTNTLPAVLHIDEKTDIKIVPNIVSSTIYTTEDTKEITIIEQLGSWSYIKIEDITGWIRTDKIKENNALENKEEEKEEETVVETEENEENTENEEKETEKAYIAYDLVNLREEPSTSSKSLAKLKLNDEVSVIKEENSTWTKVKYEDITGYVSTSLLSKSKVEKKADTQATSRSGEESARKIAEEIVKEEQKENESKTESTNNNTSSSGKVTGQTIADYAQQFLGKPYVSAGTSPSTGFDCSGLTYYVYKQFGYTLSRSAGGQASNGREVAKSDLQPGDLVIFKNHALTKIGHVGIYIGNNKMIHASEPKTGVIITDIDSKAYKYPQRYYTARRIIN